MSHTQPSTGTSTPRSNPFATPALSSKSSAEKTGVFSSTDLPIPSRRRKFVSSRLKPGELEEKPWVGKNDPYRKRKRIEKIIFWSSIALGVMIGAGLCVYRYLNVLTTDFCLAWHDDFHNIDSDSWTFEKQTGGFGTGSFDWTTDDPQNAYTDAEGLHIVPTLTTESTDITPEDLNNGYVVNLTKSGTCSSDDYNMCSIRSNKTAGTIINPIRSARLITRGKRTLKYGRVEVVAKMPRGDWLWPAIWMMPQDSVYGDWPQSGEIDIAEVRGNNPRKYKDGRNSLGSTLHWGPSPAYDTYWRTTGKFNLQRTDFSQDFHTFGLEWTEDYMFMYVDSRLRQIFFLNFKEGPRSMWERGKFSKIITDNSTSLRDPWASSETPNAPFDQEFYLILNVAVGGTNGFWPDQIDNKPWANESPYAMKEFWQARPHWLSSWGKGDARGMTVKSVKMYKPC